MSTKTITPKELYDLHQQGTPIDLIDVRTPVEFREIHATPARNVPLDSLDPHTVMNGRNGGAEEPLYVICRSGVASVQSMRSVRRGRVHRMSSMLKGARSPGKHQGYPSFAGKKASRSNDKFALPQAYWCL